MRSLCNVLLMLKSAPQFVLCLWKASFSLCFFMHVFLFHCLFHTLSIRLSHSPPGMQKMLISVSDKQTMRNGGPMASLSLSFDLCVLYCSLRPVVLLKASMKPQPQAFHIQFVVYQKHDDQLQEQRVKGSDGFTISF